MAERKCPEVGACEECKAKAMEAKDATGAAGPDGKPTVTMHYFRAIYETCAACPKNPGK